MGYAKQVDANQVEIVRTFRKLGCSVFVASAVGKGFPDLVVGRAGITYLVECKVKGGKLNDLQTSFHQAWKGAPIHVVHGAEEAIELFKTARGYES